VAGASAAHHRQLKLDIEAQHVTESLRIDLRVRLHRLAQERQFVDVLALLVAHALVRVVVVLQSHRDLSQLLPDVRRQSHNQPLF
jgi:hypothetical protein